jgi:hypothetical protein
VTARPQFQQRIRVEQQSMEAFEAARRRSWTASSPSKVPCSTRWRRGSPVQRMDLMTAPNALTGYPPTSHESLMKFNNMLLLEEAGAHREARW